MRSLLSAVPQIKTSLLHYDPHHRKGDVRRAFAHCIKHRIRQDAIVLLVEKRVCLLDTLDSWIHVVDDLNVSEMI